MENYLAQHTLKYTNKVLSLIDKGPFSETYGCFDRNYWHYKTITDYPSATYQQLSLFLAHLFCSEIPGNEFYQQTDILNLCVASIEFWKKIQNTDGSFNEWFPNEHSHVATGFTLYAISESLLMIKKCIAAKRLDSYKPSLLKACKWLAANPDKNVINHTAGALLGIYNTYLLTGKEELLKYVDQKVKILEKSQSQEGWFQEYSGADIGYTSVTIDYLVKYYEKSGDERAYFMIEKAIKFLGFFIHPDSSSGGEYGSRNTKYLMPAGLHISTKYFEEAKYILDNFYKGIKNNTQVNLDFLDDRYFAFFFAPNYIEAAVEFEKLKPENLEYSPDLYKEFSNVFSQAGLMTKKTDKYHFICNFKKGGTIKLFHINGNLLYSDSSYFVSFKNNKLATSQVLNANIEYYLDNSEEDNIVIKFNSPFIWFNNSLPLTKYLIPFRLFNYTFGKFNSIMSLFNRKLKEKMITNPKKAPLEVSRVISLVNNTLIIDDAISKKTHEKVKSIFVPASISPMHVPSSRYVLNNDLRDFSGVNPVCIFEINKVNVTCIKTKIEVPDGK